MTPILALALLLTAAAGTAVVRTKDPLNQAFVASFYGLILGIVFLVYQAPDVALSQITVGAVALPLMILLALAKIGDQDRRREEAGEHPPEAAPHRPEQGDERGAERSAERGAGPGEGGAP
jgi:uncharacterized MnhB-related membrane protein